jgi:hypothetical protein
MTTSMRRFAFRLMMIGLVGTAIVSPLFGQRGGGARGGGGGRASFGGGSGGGFHSAPSFGGPGFRSTPMAARGFTSQGATPQRFAPRSYAAPSRAYATPARNYAANRGGYSADRRGRGAYPTGRGRRFGGYGYPYGVANWYVPEYLGFPDDGYNPNDNVGDYAVAQQPEYLQAPEPDPAAYGAPDGDGYPTANYAPPARRQQAPLAPEPAVTLIFRDGRPPQTIHNYLLTRTTLTVVQGQKQQDINVADLDMAATVKVNKAAGVSFQPLQ